MKGIFLSSAFVVSLLLMGGCSVADYVDMGSGSVGVSYGDYTKVGDPQSDTDDIHGVVLNMESQTYTDGIREPEIVTMMAQSRELVRKVLKTEFLDEAEDGEAFEEFIANEGWVYSQKNSTGPSESCTFMWQSDNYMIGVRDIPCTLEDDLLRGYLKEYKPDGERILE